MFELLNVRGFVLGVCLLGRIPLCYLQLTNRPSDRNCDVTLNVDMQQLKYDLKLMKGLLLKIADKLDGIEDISEKFMKLSNKLDKVEDTCEKREDIAEDTSVPAASSAAACTTGSKRLKYSNLGESWFVDADGDDDAAEALRGSIDGLSVFSPLKVDNYNIRFTELVAVESLEFQIKLTDTGTVQVFQHGSTTASLTETKMTGGNLWKLKDDPFLINLANVSEIDITWTSNSGEVGLKKTFLQICPGAACVEDVNVTSNDNLDLPTGVNIHIPGPPLAGSGFSTAPAAVFKGSGQMIRMKNTTSGTNFIQVTFDSAVSIGTVQISLRYSLGIVVKGYSDTCAAHLIYTGKEAIPASTVWEDIEWTGLVGKVTNLRRLDIHIIYDTSLSDQLVSAKNLTFFTCDP